MGSVIDYTECPNCGKEATTDYYYKTGEEYVNCRSCGYHYSRVITNRGKKLNELTDEDWRIDEVKNPYGAFRYKIENSVAFHCGCLESEQDANEFRTEILKQQDVVVEYAEISRFVDGDFVVEKIIV